MTDKRIILIILSLVKYEASGSIIGHSELSSREHFEYMESCLEKEAIVDISPFVKAEGIRPTHKIKLITLESGLKALFKTGEYHYAEVAGYRLSKLLNIFLVPPTIFRTIAGTQGSLQLYIHAPNLASLANPSKVLEKIDKKAISDMQLFYYLAGQWDTHYGNQLIVKKDNVYRLWLIDNSSIYHRSYSKYKSITYIEKGTNTDITSYSSKAFPFENARTITGDQVHTLFSPYISSKMHLRSLSKQPKLTYIIWNSTLWLAYNTKGPSHISRHTTAYFSSTLSACMNLTQENLSQVWDEVLLVEPSSTKELIELMLIRRNELLKDSLLRSIIED